MKKHLLLAIIAVYSVFLTAQSPIVITSTFMPSNGDTARYSNASLTSLGNYTITGANYQWNFSSCMDRSGFTNLPHPIHAPYQIL